MKIKYCDEYNTAIVELSKDELGDILGVKFGDMYDNNGKRFAESLIGKEFDLHAFKDSKRSISVAHDLKHRTAKDLRDMAERLERTINFSLPEIVDKEGSR